MIKKKSNYNSTSILKRLFTFMKPYKKGLFFAIFLIFISSAFNSIGPLILGKATDALSGIVVNKIPVPEAINHFIITLSALAIVYLLYCIFKYLSIHIMVSVSEKTIFDLRSKVDDKLKKLPLNYFDTHAYGDILSRVTNDVDTISTSLQQSIDQIITSIVTASFIFVIMLIISPALTLIGIITVPLALILSMKIARYSQKLFKAQQDTIGSLNGYVEEIYTGHHIIGAFGKENEVIEEFKETSANLYSIAWKAQFLSSLLQPITQTMTNIGYVFVAVISGWLCITGSLTIGMIQSFIQYLRQFAQPITQTVQITNILQSTIAAASRIFEFLDETEEISENSNPQVPKEIQGKVFFEHVRFGYTPHRILIHDVNLTINPGNKVAIVGPTGAGKTTLVNLLLRFYDVNNGSIKIDSVDIKNMKRETLRAIFGMVLQDTWLFTGTIKENIRYGRLTATDEEVVNAAKAAHAHHFIKALPNGYDMQLSEGASNLAQGERQLLTIARAILADCPIMILDEATSSVDTRTEVLIQQAMANLMKGRTSFVIAHRLSTIRDADMIIYMQDGDIKEVGTHEELMNIGKLYKSLYNSQFSQDNNNVKKLV